MLLKVKIDMLPASVVEVNETDIEKEILNLDENKASQNSHMATKVIKEISDIFSSFLCTSFNSSIKTVSLMLLN